MTRPLSPAMRRTVAGLTLSAAALVGIVLHEGYTDRAVIPVKGDVPTIGFGTTTGVKLGDTTTPPKALAPALTDVQQFEGALKQCVTVPLAQHEYDALVSFSYNVGSRAFCQSTLVRKLNAEDYAGACAELLRWRFFQGKDCALPANARLCGGLATRREAEYRQCIGGGPMSVIPWPYRLLAMAAFAVALVGFGWIKGATHVQAQWDAAIQQQALQAAAVRERQEQATVKVITEYVDRVRVVREKGDTIIKEVPVYVPVQADAACTINSGFVRLHDAAAAGELPEPARDADEAAAGIALSAVAGTVAANYQTCHENAEQLRALQAWVSAIPSATK